MKSIAPEWVWGSVIFTIGVVLNFGLFTEWVMMRRVLGFTSLFLWILIDMALWVSGTQAIAPVFISTSVAAAVLVNISLTVGNCRE